VVLSWCGAAAADVWHRMALERSGGGGEAQSPCPGNRLRPAVDAAPAGSIPCVWQEP
jgi:hypothetical protein